MGDRRAEYQFARNSQILRDGGVELCMRCSSFQTHSSGKKARVAGPLADFTPDGCKIRIEEDACLLLHWHVPAVPRKLKPNPRGDRDNETATEGSRGTESCGGVSVPFLRPQSNPVCMSLSMVKFWFLSHCRLYISPHTPEVRSGLD